MSLLSQNYRHLLLFSHKMTTLLAPFFYLEKIVDLFLLKQQTKSLIFLSYTLNPLPLSLKTITKRKKNKTSSPCSFFWISFSFLRLDQERTSLMIFPSSPFCSLGSQPKETLFYSFSLFRNPTSLPWPSWPFIAKAWFIACDLEAELSRWSETDVDVGWQTHKGGAVAAWMSCIRMVVASGRIVEVTMHGELV